jgi:hypothetical protein
VCNLDFGHLHCNTHTHRPRPSHGVESTVLFDYLKEQNLGFLSDLHPCHKFIQDPLGPQGNPTQVSDVFLCTRFQEKLRHANIGAFSVTNKQIRMFWCSFKVLHNRTNMLPDVAVVAVLW